MDILALVLAGSTAAGGGGTIFLWLDTRGDRARDKRKAEIAHVVDEALAPVRADLRELRAKLETELGHSHGEMRSAIGEALEPMKQQLTALDTKVEPLWKALVDSAIRNAEVLHHPDDRRRQIDTLLDHFKEDVLTPDEEGQLRRFLVKIKNWEPGTDAGFPVYDGEPAAAASLLSLLDLVKAYRREHRK